MKQSSTRITIWLSTSAIRRLDQLAQSRNVTRVSLIRDAVDQFCDSADEAPHNYRRLAMLAEYSQAALDFLLRQEHPKRVEDVVALVASRMEQFHGTR